MRREAMPPLVAEEEDPLPSTPGKFKIDYCHHRQLRRCFASTNTSFLWALFLIALTASYLNFQSLVSSDNRLLAASWGDIQREKQVRVSTQPRRPAGHSVLVTGLASFVGAQVSLGLKKRGNRVVGS